MKVKIEEVQFASASQSKVLNIGQKWPRTSFVVVSALVNAIEDTKVTDALIKYHRDYVVEMILAKANWIIDYAAAMVSELGLNQPF